MTKSVYDIIKRQNGEAFARAIRQFDNGIFEVPNLPRIVRYAGCDALPLLAYLEGLKINIDQLYKTDKSPFQLLKEAGYDAFYVDTLEKQNSIQKYFAKGEELCTFHDETRFKNYHIIHAIKKGADKLKREDFLGKEQREDEYGTSVISIQILKEGGFIKICNRYNHTVENPDNTFHSNPDNIIKGLLDAFKKYFNILIASAEMDLPDDYLIISDANGHKIIQYYTEENDVFLASKGYVKNGVFYKLNSDSMLAVNKFLIDLKNKKVINICQSDDALYILLKIKLQGKKLQVETLDKDKKILFLDGKEFIRIRNNRIISMCYDGVYMPNEIFNYDGYIERFEAPNVEEISNCLNHCPNLKYVDLNACSEIFSSLLCLPNDIKINANKLFERGIFQIGNCLINPGLDRGFKRFMTGLNNEILRLLNDEFAGKKMDVVYKGNELICSQNNKQTVVFRDGEIVSLHLEKVRFLNWGNIPNTLERLSLPNVEHMSKGICSDSNSKLTYLSVPKLKEITKDNFKYGIKELDAPHLEEIKDGAFYEFKGDSLYLPKLRKIGENCFVKTNPKTMLFAPNLVVDRKKMPFLMVPLTSWRPPMLISRNNDYLLDYKRKNALLNRQRAE